MTYDYYEMQINDNKINEIYNMGNIYIQNNKEMRLLKAKY